MEKRKKTMKTIPEKYRTEGTFPSYTGAIVFNGDMVITSGQCCDHYEGFDGQIPKDIQSQTRLAIQACKEKLEAAGSSLEKVVFVEVNLVDMADWPLFNEVYKELMPCPRPARKTVEVGLLPGYRIELVMLATK